MREELGFSEYFCME